MQKIRSFSLALLLAAATLPAAADDRTDAAIGAGLGGALGAVIGYETGGRNGAILGGALGGAGGAAVATDRDRRYDRHDRHDRHDAATMIAVTARAMTIGTRMGAASAHRGRPRRGAASLQRYGASQASVMASSTSRTSATTAKSARCTGCMKSSSMARSN